MNAHLISGLTLAAAALTGAAPSTTPVHAAQPRRVVSPSRDRQMLFRVRGTNGGTVYLLGSVHLLSPEAGKLPPIVDSIYARATTVAFETSIDTLQARAMELMMRARYTDGRTLHSSFSPAGAARLDTLLKAYGINPAQVDGFKPWFVSMLFTQLVMQRSNFSAQYGVDMQINARAKAEKKPTMGLESADTQLGMFDGISQADQERMVLKSVGPDSSARMLLKIKDAWSTGDVETLDRLLNEGLKDSPALFATLVTNRNAAWVPKIEKLLERNEDALVVVGAAHLVGKQGLVSLLRAKGYVVEQM